MQRALIQYRNPKNYDLVSEALHKAGRTDLIGFDKKCLIRPRQLAGERRGAEAVSWSKGKAAGGNGRTGRPSQGRTGGRLTQSGGGAYGAQGRTGARSQQSGAPSAAARPKKKTIRNVHRKAKK